jgi:hypothetical protein
MMGKPRLRPWEIERLTMTEVALLCDQDLEKRRPPAGGQAVPHDRDASFVKWRNMTALERIEMAREHWGVSRTDQGPGHGNAGQLPTPAPLG